MKTSKDTQQPHFHKETPVVFLDQDKDHPLYVAYLRKKRVEQMSVEQPPYIPYIYKKYLKHLLPQINKIKIPKIKLDKIIIKKYLDIIQQKLKDNALAMSLKSKSLDKNSQMDALQQQQEEKWIAILDPDNQVDFYFFQKEIEVVYIKKIIDMNIKNFNSFQDMYSYMNEEFGSEFDKVEEDDEDEYAIILNDQEIQAIYQKLITNQK